MEIDAERIERVIDRAVGRTGRDARPAFYAVTGSHIYGFPDEDGGEEDGGDEHSGDVDVRGFHVADGERYALLDEPEEQIVVNQDGLTEGFEDYPGIDLVSYELKKFGTLCYEANFNVLEVVFDGIEVVNDVPREVAELRRLVGERLPLDVPRTYYGMARTNYRRHLDPERRSETPTAKMVLYVLRGLLAARHVQDERAIEADVRELSRHVLGDTALVDDLVAAKRDPGLAGVNEKLASRADETIARLFDEVEPPEDVDKSEYREAIDDWMLAVRA